MSLSSQPSAGQKSEGNDHAHLFVFTNSKAGMTAVDKSKVNKVVYESSKDSAFFAHAERKDAKTDLRVEKMRRSLASLRHENLGPLRASLDRKAAALERGRDLSRVHVVIDLDCFFAAVAALDDPSLRGKPFAVGGIGMLSTSSYEARKFGVRSAMPGFIAKKLCPQLIIVPTDFQRYQEMAKITRAVFAQYDPHFRAGSLDEAYLDITKFLHREGAAVLAEELGRPGECRTTTDSVAHAGASGASPGDNDSDEEEECDFGESGIKWPDAIVHAVVRRLRRQVFEATGGLTCSAGVAPTPMLAKICSDLNKPDGQMLLPWYRGAVLNFVRSLAVRKVPGVGKVTEKLLGEGAGIKTVGDLWERRAEVFRLFKPSTSEWLLRVALGCDSGKGDGESPRKAAAAGTAARKRKSISTERTFRNCSDIAQLLAICRRLCESLADACGDAGCADGDERAAQVPPGGQVPTANTASAADESVFEAASAGAAASQRAAASSGRSPAHQLRARSIRGRNLLLKVKTSSFDVLTRQVSVAGRAGLGYGDADEMFKYASSLLKTLLAKSRPPSSDAVGRPCSSGDVNTSLRLMGIRLTQLTFPPTDKRPGERDFFLSFKQAGSLPPSPVPAQKQATHLGEDSAQDERVLAPATVPVLQRCAQRPSHLDSSRRESESVAAVVCPICGETDFFGPDANARLNAHIDECLNAGVIREERRRLERAQPYLCVGSVGARGGGERKPPKKRQKARAAESGSLDRFFSNRRSAKT